MRVLITGACGFVGSAIARRLRECVPGIELWGIDNLSRPGSEENRRRSAEWGLRLAHGDVRMASDMEALPDVDWVVDAAANPSVLAGIGAGISSRQLMEHNLGGTVNVLEFCRRSRSGLILLSSSRVYSIAVLSALPVCERDGAFVLDAAASLPPGVSPQGVSEDFSTASPISLYGSSKLASELLAFEYGHAFEFPVWVNRCGVIAGSGQFGTAGQGIFTFWLHAHAARVPLGYTGFGGKGWQVRDAMHPDDLADLLLLQMGRPEKATGKPFNVGGGPSNAMSLAQLTDWCNRRFGRHQPEPDGKDRPYDIPWLVMDNSTVHAHLGWSPRRSLPSILEEISGQVESRKDWLEVCGAA